ncbi:MAG: hypothetical protein IPM27_07900 [Nitrosomonadales bacterium]|nr:hypothetical protein [Nitrosomonadales bacterium]
MATKGAVAKTASTATRPAVKKAPAASKPKPAATAKPALKPSDILKQRDRKTKKEGKVKVVRDSFTMPRDEYQKIAELKELCQKSGLHVKKSEVLRAGLKMLAEVDAAKLKLTLEGLEKIKTGRPRKH